MKKVTIAIVLLVCVFLKSNGQDKLSYGPMIGVSMTAFSDGFAPLVSDYAFGYNVGANVNYQIIGLVGVNASVAYAKMGGKNMDLDLLNSNNSEILKRDIDLHTIDVNVLASIYVPFSIGSIQPKVLLGVGNAYNIQATSTHEREGSYGLQKTVTTEDYTDRFKSYDIAAIGGIGAEFEFMGSLLLVDAKYRYGFTNINNVALKDEFNNTGLVLTVGYNF